MPPGGESHSGTNIPWPETAVRVRFPPGAQESAFQVSRRPISLFFSPKRSPRPLFAFFPGLVTLNVIACFDIGIKFFSGRVI